MPMRRTFLISLFPALLLVARLATADTLHGRVIDRDNLPVPGAKVLVVRGDRIVATFTTDLQGAYGPEPVPAGTYELFVAAAGFRADPRSITLGPGTVDHEVNITLIVSIASEYVVVTASHMEQVLSRVTDSTTVLDRTDLESRQITTLAEALRLVPGIHVIATGGSGAPASLLPRGGEPDYTLILVDGVPQNRFGGEFDAAHLTMQNVDRIEVIRGPASAVFGTEAIGALVHVVTRRHEPLNVAASIEGGSPRNGHVAMTLRGTRGEWSWSGSADRTAAENNNGRHAETGAVVSNDDYARDSASAEIEWQSTSGQLVRANARWGRDERGYPGPWGADPLDVRPDVDLLSRGRNQRVSLGLSGLLHRSRGFQHQFQLAWTSAQTDFSSDTFHAVDRSRRALAHYHFEVEVAAAMSLTAGSEVVYERADDTLIRRGDMTAVPVQRMFSSWFGELRRRFGGRGFVTAGVRAQRITRDDVPGQGVRPPISFANMWAVNPSFAATWFLRAASDDGWTKLRVGAARGVKMPTTLEVAFTETPDLPPERIRTMDAGVEHSAFGHRLLLESTWFQNDYRDLVAAVLTPLDRRDRYALSNVSRARAMGVENAATWRTLSGFSALVNATWLRAEVVDVDPRRTAPFQAGSRLIRRPRVQAAGSLSLTRPSGTLFISATGRSAMSDLEPNLGQTVHQNPAFVSVSAGGSISLRPRVQLSGRVGNLFNRRYEETLGYPALGRTLTLGLTVNWGR
jgi:vitamin B12 transporter